MLADLAASLARRSAAIPDLVDAACLAHDLGHPPFGHNGESALAGSRTAGGALACGGFEGNAQSLRLLTRLEPKVLDAGLNLTRATLDAASSTLVPRTVPAANLAPENVTLACPPSTVPTSPTFRLRVDSPGAPARRRCLEAQVMDWAMTWPTPP